MTNDNTKPEREGILESAQSQRLHYSQSMSPIPTFGEEPRCTRYIRNFGREAVGQFK
jgi:hypothetical protein